MVTSPLRSEHPPCYIHSIRVAMVLEAGEGPRSDGNASPAGQETRRLPTKSPGRNAVVPVCHPATS